MKLGLSEGSSDLSRQGNFKCSTSLDNRSKQNNKISKFFNSDGFPTSQEMHLQQQPHIDHSLDSKLLSCPSSYRHESFKPPFASPFDNETWSSMPAVHPRAMYHNQSHLLPSQRLLPDPNHFQDITAMYTPEQLQQALLQSTLSGGNPTGNFSIMELIGQSQNGFPQSQLHPTQLHCHHPSATSAGVAKSESAGEYEETGQTSPPGIYPFSHQETLLGFEQSKSI